MPYAAYSVVRFVPDELRDEAINIGVLLEDTEHRLHWVGISNFSRVTKLDTSTPKAALERLLAAYTERFAEYAQEGTVRLRDLLGRYSGGKIQLTAPRTTAVGASPATELAQLKTLLLLEEGHGREHGVTDVRLKSEVKQSLLDAGVVLSDRVRYATNRQPIRVPGRTAQYDFDLSFALPQKTELFRCISFDVEYYRDKIDAAKVLVFDAGEVKANAPQNVIVGSILHPPRRFLNGQAAAFESATAILEGEHIPVFDFSRPHDRQALIDLGRQVNAEQEE